jgi:hypothetical protein
MKPNVTFDVAGEHIITLTVSDGSETGTDTVKVTVGSPENCGDGVCSLSEDATGTCPEDCPVCQDAICGAGEGLVNSTFYCAIDCNIAISLSMTNASPLVAGNATNLVAVDPTTGTPVLDATIRVTAPNGTVYELTPIMGRAQFVFKDAGKYTVAIASDTYAPASFTIDVRGVSDMGWLLWIVVIIVIVVLVLFLIRFMNMRKRGGRRGYRAKNFRRGKSTLSSL